MSNFTEDCNKHIAYVDKGSVSIEGRIISYQIFIFNKFMPEAMIECTPISERTNMVAARAIFRGVSVALHKEATADPRTHEVFVSVKDGSTRNQAEVFRQFTEQLGMQQTAGKWHAVTSLATGVFNLRKWRITRAD